VAGRAIAGARISTEGNEGNPASPRHLQQLGEQPNGGLLDKLVFGVGVGHD
jgi:hypothetical protein